jgi:predicted HTH transcriptional regulator
VYDPTVSVWNDGELEKLSIEDLSREHDSCPRNPLIADIFYRAGYIEAWGRGTLTIIDETLKSGLPKPTFQNRQGGLEVVFQRNPILSDSQEINSTLHIYISTSIFSQPPTHDLALTLPKNHFPASIRRAIISFLSIGIQQIRSPDGL